MKVDEIDLKNYNDLMFWKESEQKLYLNNDKLMLEALKERRILLLIDLVYSRFFSKKNLFVVNFNLYKLVF